MPFGRAAGQSYTDAERIRYWWYTERERLLAALGAIDAARLRVPPAPDEWSAHELIAHRLFWEAHEREALDQYLQGQRPALLEFPLKRLDAANASALEALQGSETAALLRALVQLRASSAALVERIEDVELETARNPARILLGVALEHDREHRRQIEAWPANPPPGRSSA